MVNNYKAQSCNYKMSYNYNPALLGVILNTLNPQKNERILDVGCNRGFYVKHIEDYTKMIIGIDISPEVIKNAITKKVRIGDAENLDFEDNIFDKIYSLNTIEHLSDPKRFLSETVRVLKPGGTMLIIYPWEPIRGIQAIPAAIKNYKNPFMCRKIHLYKLTPSKVKNLSSGLFLKHIKSKFIFSSGCHYMTVFKKAGG